MDENAPKNEEMPEQIASDVKKNSKSDSNKDIGRVMVFFYFAISIALILTGVGPVKGGRGAGITSVLWATGGLAVGTFAGFLFGIPKILQRNQDSEEPEAAKSNNKSKSDQTYRQQVNTNLTEISDWLTKIIVGLGLINLRQIPTFIQGKADVLTTSLKAFDSAGDYHAFAVAVIVTFPTFGFLFGYLSTRLYLASAFARADLAAINSDLEIKATSGSVESLNERVSVLTTRLDQISSKQTPAKQNNDTPDISLPAGSAPEISTKTPSSKESPSEHPIESPESMEPPAKKYDPHAELKNIILQLGHEYVNIKSENKDEWFQIRNRIAERMALVINANLFIRDWVADNAMAKSRNGLVAGLATAINLEPEIDDVRRILAIARYAKLKHSKWKVATAIGRLFEAKIASINDIHPALEVLSDYQSQNPDLDLRRRINQTLAQIAQSTGRNVAILPS